MAFIGRRSAAIDVLLGGQPGGFVTAWNPLSRRRPEAWNRRMQHALLAAARRLPVLRGRGVAESWYEEHLLIAAEPGRLVVLARRFRQRAIVVVGRGRPARLVLVRAYARDTPE